MLICFLLKAASSAIKSKLFAMGLKKKQSLLDKGRFTNDTIWDKLIFKKLKDTIGNAAGTNQAKQ